MPHGTVILRLCHIYIGHCRVSFLETVHRKVVSLLGHSHRLLRHETLLPLVIELADGRKHLASEIILRLLHLCPYDLLRRLSPLHLAFALAPVEDRNAEGYAHRLLIQKVLESLRQFRPRL